MLPYLKVCENRKNRFLGFLIALGIPIVAITFGIILRIGSRYKKAELFLKNVLEKITKWKK